MKLSRFDLLLASMATALGVAGTALLLKAWRKQEPGETERKRRQRVGRIGRITRGEILDVVEEEAEAPRQRKWKPRKTLLPNERATVRRLAVYRYWIAGVSYETAQDLSDFWSEFAVPLPGQLASVKYDPEYPSNSIVMAENWRGLKVRGGHATPRKGP